jgi:uncharacterized protein (DUF58 family)
MTPTGIGSFVLGLILAVIGAIERWAAFCVLGGVLILLAAIGASFIIRRPQVRLEREIQPDRVTKGDPAIVFLNLENRGLAPIPPTEIAQPFGDQVVSALLPRLRGGQRGVQTMRLPTSRRGIFEVGPLELSRSDPFGMARVTERHGATTQIWVQPKVLSFVPIGSGITRNLEGPTSDSSPEGSITFHRLREYVTGDDLRMIHWRSTAKTGRLMVRHNVDTSQPFTAVLLDLQPLRYSAESFELAVDAAASAVTASAMGRSPVQLRCTDGSSVGGPRSKDHHQMLDHLTGVAPSTSGSLDQELAMLRGIRGGTALIIVTGAIDEQDLPKAASMRQQFEKVVVVSVTPGPTAPPSFPGVNVISGSTEADLCASWNIGVGVGL